MKLQHLKNVMKKTTTPYLVDGRMLEEFLQEPVEIKYVGGEHLNVLFEDGISRKIQFLMPIPTDIVEEIGQDVDSDVYAEVER